MSEVAVRDNILALERAMLEQPQVSLPLFHHFAEGVYVRELHAPKGTLITGKIHRTEHICMLIKGQMAVVTEQGHKVIEAPSIFVAPAGTKRVGFALEDCIWVNVHPTHERDLDKIERQFIAESFEALEADVKPLLEDKT